MSNNFFVCALSASTSFLRQPHETKFPGSGPAHLDYSRGIQSSGHILNYQIDPETPYTFQDNYPGGDFTTAMDIPYTTDKGSMIWTSVPTFDIGSSSITWRRGEEIPHHLQWGSQTFPAFLFSCNRKPMCGRQT